MSNPEFNDDDAPALLDRMSQPFRILFLEGFRATWKKHKLFCMISLSLLGVGMATVTWWFAFRESTSPDDFSVNAYDDGSNGSIVSESELADIAKQLKMDQAEWERLQNEGQRQEKIAIAKYRLTCVQQLADRARDAINTCRDEAIAWQEDMKDFESSPIDWLEPTNRALLGRVEVLLSLKTPDKIDADDLLDQHKDLTGSLDLATTLGEATSPSDLLEHSLNELEEKARSKQEILVRRRAMLRSIRNATTSSSEENLPDVRVAIAQYQDELTEAQDARIQEKLVKARLENETLLLEAKRKADAALTEAKLESDRIQGEIEADKIVAEARNKKTLQEIADAEAQLVVNREKREREFKMDLPKIQHYLVAFTTSDTHHPTKGTTIEKMPYPLSYLESEGALIPNDVGFKRLSEIVTSEIGSRPRGPLLRMAHLYSWRDSSPEQRAPTIVAQELLRKYGILMVDKKMLLP